MTYHYENDDTSVGHLSLCRKRFDILLRAYIQLREALEEWNMTTLTQGALSKPYVREVEHLDGSISYVEKKLENNDSIIVIKHISVSSARFAKAALLLEKHHLQQKHDQKAEQGWPGAVLRTLAEKIDEIDRIADKISEIPHDVLWELIPKNEELSSVTVNASDSNWDAFICHASEDKDDFVRPLADALRKSGLSVWLDEFTLKVGDSLRRAIDHGLASSKFGVVVVSHSFLDKEWPQKELDGLVAREAEGTKVILPVWHNISADEVRKFSPILADRFATCSSSGLPRVVADITAAIKDSATG